MSDPRFLQKRRERTWARFRIWLIALLAVSAVVGVVWVVGWSRVLAVRSVDVRGVSTLSEADVREKASVPLGEPLVRVDADAVSRRVGTLTRVESTEVSRRWPRTVRIEVTERRSVAWFEESGEISGIDRDGMVFRTYADKPDKLREMRLSLSADADESLALAAGAKVIEDVRSGDPDLFDQVRRVDVASPDAIVLRLSEGRAVTWGSAGKPAQKLEVLDALLTISADDYDVSAPDQPTTKK